MNITFNINPKVLDKLVSLIERGVSAYERVHATDLRDEPPVTEKAKVFYQSDKALYDAELKKKVEKAVREEMRL